MFRRRKTGEKKRESVVPTAPHLTDGNDALWYKTPVANRNNGGASPGRTNTVPVGQVIGRLSEGGQPSMHAPTDLPSTASTYYDGVGGASLMSSNRQRHCNATDAPSRGKVSHSADELCSAINNKDWDTVIRIIQDHPKVVAHQSSITLKGQITRCFPLSALACSDPPIHVLKLVLKQHPSAASSGDRSGDRLPLHWACIANASSKVIEIIAAANPSACKHQDSQLDRTPLHYLAIQANSSSQIDALMEMDKRAVLVKDKNFQTPLDLAQDSTNPDKMDIIPALQRRRGSSGIFSNKKKIKARHRDSERDASNANDNRTSTARRSKSPGKFSGRSKSPGKFSRRSKSPGRLSARSRSPGKYVVPEFHEQQQSGGNDQYGHVPTKGRLRSSRASRGSIPNGKASSGTGVTGSGYFSNDISEESGPSNSGQKLATVQSYPSSKNYGGGTNANMPQGQVVSQTSQVYQPPLLNVYETGELSMPKGQVVSQMPSSHSPLRYSQQRPKHSPQRHSPQRSSSSAQEQPPSYKAHSPQPSSQQSKYQNPSSITGEQTHQSVQDITPQESYQRYSQSFDDEVHDNSTSMIDGMSENILELKVKLEDMQDQIDDMDSEIEQMDLQILGLTEEQNSLDMKLEDARENIFDEELLYKKQDHIAMLKKQIASLQIELEQSVIEVENMYTKREGNYDEVKAIEKSLQDNREGQSTLQAVKDALQGEKEAAEREFNKTQDELKSLETILMLSQEDDF